MGEQARARDDQEGRSGAEDGGWKRLRRHAEADHDERHLQAFQQHTLERQDKRGPVHPVAGHPSASAVRSPMPRRPLALTRAIPLRSHCRPKTSSSDPTTSRSAPTGTAVRAVPSATTSTASTARPPPAPSQVDRHPRTLPTPTTMITISMTSTQAARNEEQKTEE